MWSIHAVQDCLAIRREVLIHAAAWMSLETCRMKEARQGRGRAWFRLHELSRTGNPVKTDRRRVVARGWGTTAKGPGVYFGVMKIC